MTPAPLQLGQAPSELALNNDGLTPLALAKASARTPSGDVDVHVLQVVGARAAYLQRLG